jgi:hypothetical protein
MKKKLFLLSGFILGIIFIIISCQLNTVSISERIAEFVSDLNKNTDRNLYENYHSDMPPNLYYDDATNDATELSKDYDNFSITLTGSAQDLGGGVMYQAGTLNSTSAGAPFTIKFNFKEEDRDVWYILAISIDGDGTWGALQSPP